MQRVRDVLRGSLGRALSSLCDEDRLAAAWPVACGPVLAARAEVLDLDTDGILHVRVLQTGWQEQFLQMRTALTEDLRRIAGVRLQAIHFEGQGMKRQARGERTTPAQAAASRAKQTSVARRRIVEKH